MAHRRLDLWQNLPVLVVVLWGGFATNFLWSMFLIVKNHSWAQFAGAPGVNPMGAAKAVGETLIEVDPALPLTAETLVKNYVLAALAGVIWIFSSSSLHGADQDRQVRLSQLDPAHGEHHHFRHTMGR